MRFSNDDIRQTGEFGDLTPFTFTCAMISTCKPLFDDCEDNHEVADKLIKAKVIRGHEDSESCQLFVNFRTRKSGEGFIRRLNKYLDEKEALLRKAREF
jgi:hypothetical protein